jgi:hypothetical protein
MTNLINWNNHKTHHVPDSSNRTFLVAYIGFNWVSVDSANLLQ